MRRIRARDRWELPWLSAPSSLTDDVDGKTADETVNFGLDGITYEIDVSNKNATALRTQRSQPALMIRALTGM